MLHAPAYILCDALHASTYIFFNALHCIHLHVQFLVHCIVCPCICTFWYIIASAVGYFYMHCITLHIINSFFSRIKEFLGGLAAQAYVANIFDLFSFFQDIYLLFILILYIFYMQYIVNSYIYIFISIALCKDNIQMEQCYWWNQNQQDRIAINYLTVILKGKKNLWKVMKKRQSQP